MRRVEIEQAALARVRAVGDPGEVSDPAYAEGLHAAVAAAVDYTIVALERGEDHGAAIPPILLSQVRLAARNGVALDTVLRRYFAGHVLFGDFVIEEAERSGLGAAALKQLLRTQAALFDRLLAGVSEAHTRERESRFRSFEQRQGERVKRLLAGEPLDMAEFAYDFEGWHLGGIAVGAEAEAAVGELAGAFGRRALLVRREERMVWAWIGSRRDFQAETLEGLAARTWPAGVALAIGEPLQGLLGWRLTHRQARAALPIALRRPEAFARYRETALLASALRDDLLVTSLRQMYIAPLEEGRDGGRMSRETLRAYFAADRNVSSTAAALGVNRNTVASRLRAIEVTIQRPLMSCAADLEAAIHLDELTGRTAPEKHGQTA